MSQSRQVLFRCDASPEIGAGHIMRCLTLAEALTRRGLQARILALPATRATVAAIAGAAIEIIETPAADDPATLLSLARDGAALIGVDSYHLDTAYLTALRGGADRLLVLEDSPHRTLCADIVLDPAPGRRPEHYQGLIRHDALALTGPAYALLRPAFARARAGALVRRRQAPVQRLLVALGGGDARGALASVLDGVARSGLSLDVHVAGPPPETAPATLGAARLIVHGGVSAMHALMSECDLAIGAAGGSAWERAALGLPSLIIELADNQADTIAGLVAAGAARRLGRAGALDTAAIADDLTRLAKDGAARVAMARAGALLCDGLGAGRVALALFPHHADDGAEVSLRPAAATDCRITFTWRRMAQADGLTSDPAPAIWEDHQRWFADRLQTPEAGALAIIDHGGHPAGLLWLEPLCAAPDPRTGAHALLQTAPHDHDALRLGVFIDPARRRRGVGAAALAAARDLIPQTPFYAQAPPTQWPAHALLRRAGYTHLAPDLYRRA